MEPWVYWLIAAILLCILEMFTADFLAATCAIACGAAAAIAGLGGELAAQLTAFAIVASIVLFTVRPIFKKWMYTYSDDRPSNVDALVGKLGRVIDPIAAGEAGRVKLGSEEWRAEAADSKTAIDADSRVEVIRIEGATLIVTTEGD